MGNTTSSDAAFTSTADPNAALQVQLEIVSATGIEAGDWLGLTAAMRGQLGSSDAYVVLEVEGQKLAWTRPIFNTLEPVWHETFFFTNVRLNSLCKLSLLDKDLDADDALGDTQFMAFDTEGREQAFELPIRHNDKNAGTINVKVTSRRLPDFRGEPLREYGPVRYSSHPSLVAGLMTGSFTDDAQLQSTAYKVQLHNVREFLPNEVEWNKNYPTIQPIFSPDRVGAPALRKALSAQHAMIYKHDANTTFGTLPSGHELIELLHNGRRLDKPVLYTYVIKTDKGWYFSETGAAFFKDMLSKHMLHASARLSVLYAGEFHIQQTSDGTFKLVIDNNSGTYAPPKEYLPQLQALFENNFPGIPIEALDQGDPNLQKAREEILKAWA